MKKKIISLAISAAMLLGTASAAGGASFESSFDINIGSSLVVGDSVSLSPRASAVIDGDYLKGIMGLPEAEQILSQFDGNVQLKDPSGKDLDGNADVPAESSIMLGELEILRVVVYGDANMDAKINLVDASSILKSIAKWDTKISSASADVDENGKVNLVDVSTILKYIAKWDVKLGSPADLAIAEDGTVKYKLLANDPETDSAFVEAIKNVCGVELETVSEIGGGEKYITVGADLCDKYDFIDDTAAADVDADKAYIDTYNGNVHIVMSEEGVDFVASELSAQVSGDDLTVPRGYFGPMTHMTERSSLYWDAVENILKTEPAVDGTNGMSEDIFVAISNAAYTEPKNIIYMIGDGMGKNIAIGAEYCHKDDLYGGKLAMNYLPVEGRQSTYSTDQQITDSAAGGTALATGYKTTNGTVSMNTDDTVGYKTLLELAADKGKSTGIIATKSVTDATPASFTAHVSERGEELEIARQQLARLTDGTLDLILGGGYTFYNDGSNAAVRAAAKERGVTYTNSWEEAESADLPLAGIFTEREMSTNDGSGEPHIAAMTDLALDLLSEDENGFFIMIEGSKIDTYGHNNDFGSQVDETYEFDCAVAVALRYVALNPDTVLVITADHETGELAVSSEPTPENIRGSARYSSGSHHWVDVPVYALGYGTEALGGNQENTDVAIFLAELMGEENFGQRSEVHTLVDVTDKATVDAVIKYNDNTEYINKTGDGVLVNFSKDGIQYMYVPASEFEVPEEDKATITAFRVTFTNMNDKPKRIPSCGVVTEDGNKYTAGERITYIAPGETVTYTYTLDAFWRHTGSLSSVDEFVIYSTAGYSADLLISDITAISRPLDK